MTRKNAKSRTISKMSRCLYRFPNGNRCRLPMSDASSFHCQRHTHLPKSDPIPVDLSRELTADLQKFTSARRVNQFLSNLLLLLSQDRISPRRGAVLAYTCNLLLHSLRAIHVELHPKASELPDVPVIWDMPRPDGDPPPQR